MGEGFDTQPTAMVVCLTVLSPGGQPKAEDAKVKTGKAKKGTTPEEE